MKLALEQIAYSFYLTFSLQCFYFDEKNKIETVAVTAAQYCCVNVSNNLRVYSYVKPTRQFLGIDLANDQLLKKYTFTYAHSRTWYCHIIVPKPIHTDTNSKTSHCYPDNGSQCMSARLPAFLISDAGVCPSRHQLHGLLLSVPLSACMHECMCVSVFVCAWRLPDCQLYYQHAQGEPLRHRMEKTKRRRDRPLSTLTVPC